MALLFRPFGYVFRQINAAIVGAGLHLVSKSSGSDKGLFSKVLCLYRPAPTSPLKDNLFTFHYSWATRVSYYEG